LRHPLLDETQVAGSIFELLGDRLESGRPFLRLVEGYRERFGLLFELLGDVRRLMAYL
jgi:hypothetical protein